MCVCVYTSTIYSVSVLIKTIFSKNRTASRGALGPMAFFWARCPSGAFFYRKTIGNNYSQLFIVLRQGRVFFMSRALPNAPLSRISRFRCLKCKHCAHFRIAKRTPIQDFAFQMSKMQAWCSFSHRQMYPYRGFRVSDVQSSGEVLIFASPNAPLSTISPLDRDNASCPKNSKMGGGFCSIQF